MLHVVIQGRVQRVGFRWFVRERARALHLTGWVRNRTDGSVEVLAVGGESELQQLRAALQKGPDGAVVSLIEELYGEPEIAALSRFGILETTPAQAAVNAELTSRILKVIRDIPNFPKPGIVFKDITPLLADADLFRSTTDAMASAFGSLKVSHVIAIESRGFILGAPVAQALNAGFIPVRKAGKLPARTEAEEYGLEYGTDRLEIHSDACDWARRPRLLIVDDVLATGGTADAATRLVERLGGEVVGYSFLLVLGFLAGLKRLASRPVQTLVTY